MLERVRSRIGDLEAVDRLRAGDVLAELSARRNEAYERVGQMRGEERYAALLRELDEAATRPVVSGLARHPASDLVAPVLTRAYKRLRKRVRRCGCDPSDRELHAVRIAAKHLRYALEALEPLVGSRVRCLARRAERLQSILGEEHDAVVLARRLHGVEGDPGAAFAAGELAMLEAGAAEKARSRWRSAWQAVSRKDRRFWRSGS